MTDRLDLSETQKANVEQILTANRKESEPYLTELANLRSDMHDLVKADEFYEEQARIRLETSTSAMVELMMLRARTLHDVRAELTPEQREEAEALLQKFADKLSRFGRGHRQHRDSDDLSENSAEDS